MGAWSSTIAGSFFRVVWVKINKQNMTWGFHGSDYEGGCLLGCSAHRPGDGGSTDLWNVAKLIAVYTALQPRRQPSSISGRLCNEMGSVGWGYCIHVLLGRFQSRHVVHKRTHKCCQACLNSLLLWFRPDWQWLKGKTCQTCQHWIAHDADVTYRRQASANGCPQPCYCVVCCNKDHASQEEEWTEAGRQRLAVCRRLDTNFVPLYGVTQNTADMVNMKAPPLEFT
jgi:hypothetical protein